MGWNTILSFFGSSDIKIKIAIVLFLLMLIILVIAAVVWLIPLAKNKKRKEKTESFQEPKEIEEKPEKELLLFDKKVKNYFKEYLKLDSEADYTKIAEKLRKKNKKGLADFCDRMNYLLYSGEKIEEKDIKALKKYFKNMKAIKKTQEQKPI